MNGWIVTLFLKFKKWFEYGLKVMCQCHSHAARPNPFCSEVMTVSKFASTTKCQGGLNQAV
jgi:hypothetical protein